MRAPFVLSIFLSSSAFAGPIERTDDFREACRKEIAGQYLTVYDEVKLAKNQITVVETAIESLRKNLAESEKTYSEARKIADESEYDQTKIDRANQAAVTVRTLKSQIIQQNDLLTDAQKKAAIKGQREKFVRENIGRVFKIEEVQEEPGKGYAFRVIYRTPCPKFRYLCPLPPSEAKALKEILPGEETPLVCKRYGSYR